MMTTFGGDSRSCHVLNFRLYTIPITLHVLYVNPCGGIDKFNRMIDSLVLGYRTETLYSVIGCPLITPHSCPWTNMLFNYWEESCLVSTSNYCHDTKCWSVAGVDHSKHPDVTSWWVSSMVLNEKKIFITL